MPPLFIGKAKKEVMKNYIVVFQAVMLATLFLTTNASAEGTVQYIGKTYCEIKHPIQKVTGDHYQSEHVCEEQHIKPQSRNGSDYENIVWINKFEHTRTDRIKSKLWITERPTKKYFSDDILINSYMLSREHKGYHFLRYDYSQRGNRDWAISLFKLDGASHAVYTWGSIVNFPAKELEYINFMVHNQSASSFGWWVDFIFGVVVDFFEVFAGFFYGCLGLVVGSLFNPIDTISNIPMGIYYLADTTFFAALDFVVEGFHFVSFGYFYD